ncbi:MAG: 4Fe-4S binding protein [Caldilineaceae bacterium]|nr:4Fe-4S binding protein [Caldilineaceae bacterium]
MLRQLPLRQRIRTALITISFLLFPLTIYYFSPYVIIDGAMAGIVSGSAIVFGVMFLTSLFFGRLWCGWACPAGGLQEVLVPVNGRPVQARWADRIKWFIWVPWMLVIVAMFIQAGGPQRVDFFHMTTNGISMAEPSNYPIFYVVIGLFVVLSLTVGRRAGCHTICWMAPFMILARKTRNALGLPALGLVGDAHACVDCRKCTTHCPMSLDVHGSVNNGRMEDPECILCGTCVDNCSKHAIRFTFQTPGQQVTATRQ